MTLVIAHRGNSSAAPENTLASFQSALDVGATLVECDVQMTRDGSIVVIHDPTLDRTSNVQGDVREMSLDAVKDADVSYPSHFGTRFAPQRVPTLVELIGFLKGKARLMVEIKGESSIEDRDDFERRIAADIVKSGARIGSSRETDVVFLSFSTTVLERMASLLPDVPRGHVFYRDPEEQIVAAAARAKAEFIMPERGHLGESLLARAKREGLGVATWVCDDVDDFRKLSQLDLIGIGTNRPAEMLAAIAASA